MAYLDIQKHRKNPVGLLRHSYREDGKVKKETLGRITGFTLEQLQLFQAALQGKVIKIDEMNITRSREYGASNTLIQLIQSIGLDQMIYSRTSESWMKLVLGMIIGQLLYKGSKLSLTRIASFTTLWSQLGVEEMASDANNLYDAMDELYKRQSAIQRKLAKKHLHDGELLLYDITSSYLVGDYDKSDLVDFGYNRDRKRGFEQIVIGLMCNQEGCPIGVEVFRGNTSDKDTVEDQLKKVTQHYGLSKITFFGDRGMIHPNSLEEMPSLSDDGVSLSSVTALTHSKIKKICKEHQLTNKNEETFPIELPFSELPGKRVVVYYNPQRAQESQQTRQSLIKKTEDSLKEIQNRKRPVKDDVVGIRVGKVINKYKVGKLFDIQINNGKLNWTLRTETIENEASYDGLYAVVTDVSEEDMPTEDIVRNYKRLSRVEQAFRVLKSSLLELRPMYHRMDERICSHVFICMLAYYVYWHMADALSPLWTENTSGQNWNFTMDYVLENLKVIQENDINVQDMTVKKINEATEEQQRIIDLILRKK